MIVETMTKQSRPAISSDRWHVVRARWTGDDVENAPHFVRSIVSEHDTKTDSLAAAKSLFARLSLEGATVPSGERDAVFIRPPNFKSLRSARTRKPKRR